MELAIVLVIIGLIVGGVLVGSDLIEAARVRATISQFDQIRAAAYAFKGKYNAIPGDISDTQASRLGISRAQATFSNEDGLIANGASYATSCTNISNFEHVYYWWDLHNSGLYPYSAITTRTFPLTVPGTTSNIKEIFPGAKLGPDLSVWLAYCCDVGGSPRENYYLLTGLETLGFFSNQQSVVTPNQARSIDEKLDDGVPNTGFIRGRRGDGAILGTAPVADCVSAGAYNMATAPDVPSCSVRFNFK